MNSTMKWFEDYKYVAVIKSNSTEEAEQMIKAAIDGGFKIFEISMQTPQAIRLIEIHSKSKDYLCGASAVRNGEVAQRAIKAGARYISSPYTDRDVIIVAKYNDVFVIQGALTPTEAINAHHVGADLIKIYPVGTFGGPDYLKAVKRSAPFLKLIAAGGVTLEDAPRYLKNCLCVTLGKALFDKVLIKENNWGAIIERGRQLTQKTDALKALKTSS